MNQRQRGKEAERQTTRVVARVPAHGFTPVFCLSFSTVLCLFLSACSVPLYKVAPIPKNTSIEAGQTATNDRVTVTASALTEDDKAFERFDTNLPLAGILVVDIQVVNRSARSIESLKFELQDATGKSVSYLEPKKVLKAIMKFEGVRMYTIEGRQQTLEQLQAMALPKKLSLGSQEEKRGVLFFHAKQDVAKNKAFTLLIKDGRETIRLPLS